MQTPRTEFAQALKAVVTEHGLDPDVVLEAIKQAVISAYRKDAHDQGQETEGFEFDAEINPVDGGVKIFSWPEGGPEKRKEVTPPGFGRIAAQTAKQVIHQKIREAEKEMVMAEFDKRVGTLVSGVVLRFEGGDVRVDIGKTEAILPQEERVPEERLSLGQRMTFLLKEIKDGPRGKEIVLSRSDPQFVVRLFAREVPEVNSKSVEIKSIVREPGVRTKMVVYSNQSGVDPVGSCVGQKGVRVQAVTGELGGERVDIIPYSENIAEIIESALSPATNLEVVLDEKKKTALVKAPEDQLSLAIGRDGQNARLAAKLTGWAIKVEPLAVGGKEKENDVEKKAKSEERKKSEEKEEVKKKGKIRSKVSPKAKA